MRQAWIAMCALALALGLAGLVPGGSASAAALTEVSDFGTNPGGLQMYVYVPDRLPAGRPVVVYLHGCGSSAEATLDAVGWRRWADERGFALVFPQQTAANNNLRCFNWFKPEDQARGSGEPASIKAMVDWTVAHHRSDARRIFVTGVSAGGGMSAIMLATYPDVFKAGAIVAGAPYRCGTNVLEGLLCMEGLLNDSPDSWGDRVRAATGWTGPWPRVSVWHGSRDTTVSPSTMGWIVGQWTNLHGTDQTADAEELVAGYPHRTYRDAVGTAVVETWTITGAGHGEFVDPGPGPEQCGTAGGFIMDVNLCASWRIASWFGL